MSGRVHFVRELMRLIIDGVIKFKGTGNDLFFDACGLLLGKDSIGECRVVVSKWVAIVRQSAICIADVLSI